MKIIQRLAVLLWLACLPAWAALTADMQWYVRFDAGANELNGGGFDPVIGAGMTNYADAASPLVDSTTGTCAVAAADHVIDASANYPADIVGNTLRSSARTGGTAAALGYFTILTRVSATELIVDRALCVTTDVTALTYRIGGAHATLVNYSNSSVSSAPTPALASPLAPGHQINLRGNGTDDPSAADYTSNGGAWGFPAGDRVTGAITLVGYNGRPHYKNAGSLMQSLDAWRIRHIKVTPTGATNPTFGMLGGRDPFHATGLALEDIYFDQNGQAIGLTGRDGGGTRGGAQSVVRSWLKNTGGGSAISQVSIFAPEGGTGILANRIQDQRGPAISLSFRGSDVFWNIITGGLGSAGAITLAIDKANHAEPFHSDIWHNTIDNNAGPGISIPYVANTRTKILNNIISNWGTYAIEYSGAWDEQVSYAPNYNAFYGTGSGVIRNVTGGINNVTLSASPYIGGGNYGLNTTVGGGAACTHTGWPGAFPGGTMTGLADIGAVPFQDQASGGLLLRGIGKLDARIGVC